jgi:hypothetical protein
MTREQRIKREANEQAAKLGHRLWPWTSTLVGRPHGMVWDTLCRTCKMSVSFETDSETALGDAVWKECSAVTEWRAACAEVEHE